MTIYLYKKTHKITGLQYLGKTISSNPYLYPGSGAYWRHHLEKHGNNVETEILRECQTEDELKEWGQHYSKLWNVVESKDWANLIEEAGSGGYWSNESKQKLSKSMSNALSQLTREQLTERMKKSCCNPQSYTAERIEKSRLGMLGKKKTKTPALLAAEEARRNRTDAQKLKCGLANKNKTWKLINGKRVWMEKI
jgi:hypothetical protein